MSFEERSFDASRIVMVPGNPPITADAAIHLAGFHIGEPVLTLSRHVYPPNLRGPTGRAAFAQMTAALPVTGPLAGALLTTFVPIVIVLVSAALMFAVRADYVEARIGIGVTSLLTLVALQLAEADKLPVLGYATVLELIVIASYVFIVSALALVARTSWLVRQDDGITRAIRFDRRAVAVLAGCYVAAVAVILLARGHPARSGAALALARGGACVGGRATRVLGGAAGLARGLPGRGRGGLQARGRLLGRGLRAGLGAVALTCGGRLLRGGGAVCLGACSHVGLLSSCSTVFWTCSRLGDGQPGNLVMTADGGAAPRE
jgi:hypothetical protein